MAVERPRTIGWIEGYLTSQGRDELSADNWRLVSEELRPLGWERGSNIRADRYIPTSASQLQQISKDVVASRPDLIIANGTLAARTILAQTDNIPVLFFGVADPVGNGLVENFARPRRNATGFALYEPALAGKWLQLLRELDPRIERAAILFNPQTSPSRSYPFQKEFERTALLLAIKPTLAPAQEASEVEAVAVALASKSGAALLVMPDAFTMSHRRLIIDLSAKYRLPAIYGYRFAVTTGGLMSYGPSAEGTAKLIASYVDQILKGVRPGDLPVQAPTKHELAINVRTAQALGISVPAGILAQADEVLE